MRLARLLLPLSLAAFAAPASAQVAREAYPAGITVSGSATIKTPPDRATISIELRGEGATPDAASTDLAKRQRAVIGGLTSLDPKLQFYTGAVTTAEIRRGDCAPTPGRYESFSSGDGEADKGPCRVTGYIASISATVELTAVDKAGTAIGLAQRLGATTASLERFSLRDPQAARNAAFSAAMTDARAQAQTLAAASGTKLGPIVSLTGAPEEVVLEANAASYDAAPEIAPAPTPVQIDVSPKPVETTARVVVVFSLAN